MYIHVDKATCQVTLPSIHSLSLMGTNNSIKLIYREFIVLSPQLQYNITRDLFSSANCEVRRANKYSFISIFALIMKVLVQIENIEYLLRKVDRYYNFPLSNSRRKDWQVSSPNV